MPIEAGIRLETLDRAPGALSSRCQGEELAKFAEKAPRSATIRHGQKKPSEQTNSWCAGLCGQWIRTGKRWRVFLGLDPMAEFEVQLRRDPQNHHLASRYGRWDAPTLRTNTAVSPRRRNSRKRRNWAHFGPLWQTGGSGLRAQPMSWRTGLYGDGTRSRQQRGLIFGPRSDGPPAGEKSKKSKGKSKKAKEEGTVAGSRCDVCSNFKMKRHSRARDARDACWRHRLERS